MKYIPLHVHTSPGSIGDSILKVKDYVSRAKTYGLDAIAITDHGSLSAIYDFFHECQKNEIKPIIGCEVYTTKDRKSTETKERSHLVLLSKNEQGLTNLLEIANNASIEGFYYKPRTDMEFLKKNGKGIIGLSACLGGDIPKAILKDNPEEAIKLIEDFKEAFDEFYLELQPGNSEEQIIVNKALIELSQYTNTPLVITNDIHYLEEDDHVPHDAHVKIARRKKLDDEPVYPDKCYWFMNYEKIVTLFPYLDDGIVKNAINNTVKIANSITTKINQQVQMPSYKTEGETEKELLTRLSIDALQSISDTLPNPAQYMSRLLYEIDTINELGFAGYFLIVKDFMDFARKNDIPVGPGRGSVGGSLIAFLLGISVADPIKHNLIFERFLSIHRKGVPDIDMDFDSERRTEMFDYAVSKYGEQNCALVSTLGMRKAKGAIRDTARVLSIDLDTADKAAKLIPQVYYGDDGEKATDLSIEESLEIVPELQAMKDEMPKLFNMAQKLSDVPSSSSIHAAGVLISPERLTKRIPLVRSNKEGIYATSLNLGDAESAGFVKFDFLSLASLNVYEKTQKDTGFKFDYLNDSYDDEKTWELIGSKYTTGLFQISSKTYKARMPRLRPKTIDELASCLALVRGPCISSGADKNYMEILEGKREIDPIHPLYYAATKETLGILIYQEQLMDIAVNFGFSLEDGYRLVKFVAKKKVGELKTFQDTFMSKALEREVEEEVAEKIWNLILDAGEYAFNRAHATTYAILSYVSGYLKAHYPKEFLTNLLTNAYNRKKKEEIVEALEDCRRLGISFLPLDINKSLWEFKGEGEKIRIGFSAIKGFGEKAYDAVIEARPFSSFEDFHERVPKGSCSKRAIIPGIFSGLFDEFGERIDIYNSYMLQRKEEPLEEIVLQSKERFKSNTSTKDYEINILGGQYISDPQNDLKKVGFLDKKIKSTVSFRGIIKDAKKIKDGTGKQMAFVTVSTGDGHIDCTMFSSTYAKYKKSIRKNNFINVKAKKDGLRSCVVSEIA